MIQKSAELKNLFEEKARLRLEEEETKKFIEECELCKMTSNFSISVIDYLFNGNKKDVYNGYVTHSLVKLKNLLLFYISRYGGVFFTMMNKLLFYTDFCHYKMYGKGISGLSYKAIQYGPVPMRWDRVYSFYNDIQQEIIKIPYITGAESSADSLFLPILISLLKPSLFPVLLDMR